MSQRRTIRVSPKRTAKENKQKPRAAPFPFINSPQCVREVQINKQKRRQGELISHPINDLIETAAKMRIKAKHTKLDYRKDE